MLFHSPVSGREKKNVGSIFQKTTTSTEEQLDILPVVIPKLNFKYGSRLLKNCS